LPQLLTIVGEAAVAAAAVAAVAAAFAAMKAARLQMATLSAAADGDVDRAATGATAAAADTHSPVAKAKYIICM
jgi:hypothetical protein